MSFPELPYNALTPGQVERLAKLAEECGEVVQMVGKILIRGYAGVHPRFPEDGTNRLKLEDEIGNVGCAVRLLIEAEDLSMDSIEAKADAKWPEIKKYMHHQG